MLKRWWHIFLLSALMSPFLGALIGSSMALFEPRLYESTSIIEVSVKRLNPADGLSGNWPPPDFLKDQIAMIQSRDFLLGVVRPSRRPGLITREENEMIDLFQKNLVVEQLNRTKMIKLQVRGRYHSEATHSAEAIISLYSRKLQERMDSVSTSRIAGSTYTNYLRQKERVAELKNHFAEVLESQVPASLVGSGLEPDDQSAVYLAARNDLDAAIAELQKLESSVKGDRTIQPGSPVVIHQKPSAATLVESGIQRYRIWGSVIGLLVSPLLAVGAIRLSESMSRRPMLPSLDLDPERF